MRLGDTHVTISPAQGHKYYGHCWHASIVTLTVRTGVRGIMARAHGHTDRPGGGSTQPQRAYDHDPHKTSVGISTYSHLREEPLNSTMPVDNITSLSARIYPLVRTSEVRGQELRRGWRRSLAQQSNTSSLAVGIALS